MNKLLTAMGALTLGAGVAGSTLAQPPEQTGIPAFTHFGTSQQCMTVAFYNPVAQQTVEYALQLRNPNAPFDPSPVQNREADQLATAVLDTTWDAEGVPHGKLFGFIPESNPTIVCSGQTLVGLQAVNYPPTNGAAGN